MLPLANLTGDPAQEYFSDGMTDALITNLASLPALRVISRQSVMRYKGSAKPLPEIARELGVEGVVEGSVVRSGGRVRITAQLVHAPTDRHLWAHSYERRMEDVLALQGEVSRAIAEEVRLTVGTKESQRLTPERTVKPEAYDAYLLGRHHWNQRTAQSLDKALSYFQAAIAADPDFALAHAGLALAYGPRLVYGYVPPGHGLAEQKTAALRALELDPGLGEARAALGSVRTQEWDWQGAETEFRNAIEDSNTGTALWYAWYLYAVGRADEAVVQQRRALELDPLDIAGNRGLAQFLGATGQDEAALAQWNRVLELEPDHAQSELQLALFHFERGRIARAQYISSAPVSLAPEDPLTVASSPSPCAVSGNPGEARQLLGRVEGAVGQPLRSKVLPAYVHLALDERDRAFALLEKPTGQVTRCSSRSRWAMWASSISPRSSGRPARRSTLRRSAAADGPGPAGTRKPSEMKSRWRRGCRHLCTLLCILPIPVLAQTKGSDLSRNSALVLDWANRVMANDPKVRATAEAALVQGAGRSLPLLRRFLNRGNEDLDLETFEIIRRIGPPAIPLLVDLLRDERVSIRRSAVDALIDLAPDTEWIQPALRRALRDEDSEVAGDAARALGALGKRASPSVRALVKTLSHEDPYVRVYAAEALASIGPKAGAATRDLARALGDPIPGVRWAAGEALASIGPAAQSAVPQLIEALKDEFLYVRICAAGALGSLGPKAQTAREALRAAANDPTMRYEAEWALNRIAGVESGEPVISPVVPAPSVAPQPQTTVAQTGNPPVDWDTTTGRNIVWSVELGNETFGRPVVAGDAVYVGTDNARQLNPAFQEECGVLMAFRVTDGRFLWQDLAPRVERGLREFLLPSTTSAPYVEGNRLYYVTAECQLRSLDTQGFRDGENSGPYREEVFKDNAAADIAWELDMCGRLGVFPHEATNSEVLPVGDLLMVSTSNGQNEGHTRVPSPRAPSLIAVNKHSGEVVWRAIGPGEQVLHGQWSSPVAANVNGRIQVLFGGGDGWLRAYDAASGHEVWRFDGNPKDARWLPRPGVLSRSSIIASPVFADGRVFIAMGQSPGHGNGPSLIYAISPNGQGDVTESRLLWTSREVGRVVGTPIAKDGLLYVGDLGGTVHCLDAATGAHVWKHETNEAIWGCLLLAGDRLYVGNVEGSMTVLRAGRRKELLAQIEMDAPLYSRPALIGDALYLATARRLYLIAAKP